MPNDEDTSETPGQIETKEKKKIISEMIAHINRVEEKINTLKEGMRDIKDLQTVNKLDIINLKNEIEQIKLSIPTLSPENIERVKAMEKLAEKAEKAEEIKDDVDKLKSDMKKLDMIQKKLAEIEKIHANRRVTKDVKTKPRHMLHIPDRLKRTKIKKCKKCGAVLIPKAKFCGRCGAKGG